VFGLTLTVERILYQEKRLGSFVLDGDPKTLRQPIDVGVRGQQRFDLRPQPDILRAGLVEKGGPFARVVFRRRPDDLLDLWSLLLICHGALLLISVENGQALLVRFLGRRTLPRLGDDGRKPRVIAQ
jgi:hypothetical protein